MREARVRESILIVALIESKELRHWAIATVASWGDEWLCRMTRLLFFNKTEKDILLLDQWEHLTSSHFSVTHILSAASSTWTGPAGRISSTLIRQHLPAREALARWRFFVCGPEPFVDCAIA